MTQQNDLANYLQLMLKAGKSKAQITSALKAACWPDDIIEKEFAKLAPSPNDLWQQPSWPVSQHTWNSPTDNNPAVAKNTAKVKRTNDKKPSSVIRQVQPSTKSTIAKNKVTVINLAKPTSEKQHQAEPVEQKNPILAAGKKVISQQQVVPIISQQSINASPENQPIANHPQNNISKPYPSLSNTAAKNPENINDDYSEQNSLHLGYSPAEKMLTTAVNLPTIEQLTKPFVIEKKINTTSVDQSPIKQTPVNKVVEGKQINGNALMEKIINRHQLTKQPLPKSIHRTQQKAKDFDKQQFKGIVFGLFLCLVALLALSWQLLVR